MDRKTALDHVIAIATMWGENAEEGYPTRIKAADTDADLSHMILSCNKPDQPPCYTETDVEDAKSIRDLWLAIEVLHKE
jgi:hypothetical protein